MPTTLAKAIAEVTQGPERNGRHPGPHWEPKPAPTRRCIWVIPRGDHLHLVLLTAKGQPIVRDLYDVPDDVLRPVVNDFMLETSSVVPRRNSPRRPKAP